MPQATTAAPAQRAGIRFGTDLGSALLIAESEDGGYEPVTVVSSINEAIEIAGANFASRIKKLERGREAMCPARYVVWARNAGGDYETVHTIEL